MTDTTIPLAGIIPTGTKTTVGGSTDRMDREFAFGERVVVVVDAVVTSVGLAKGPNGPIIARKLAAVELYELDEERGKTIVRALTLERRAAPDPALGHENLPGFEVKTDGDGVVLTAGELAEVLGDAVAAKTDGSADYDGFGGDNESISAAVDWLRANARSFYDDLVDDALSTGELVAKLRAEHNALPPTALRSAMLLEEHDPDAGRGVILDYLDERLALELARIASEEPWVGYKALTIADVVAHLMANRDELEALGRWPDVLEAVAAYETGHKARKGVLDYVYGQTTIIPPAPADVTLEAGVADTAEAPAPDLDAGGAPDTGEPFGPDDTDEPDDEVELDATDDDTSEEAPNA